MHSTKPRNMKSHLTALIFNLRHFISNYDMEIAYVRQMGSDLPMLEVTPMFKLRPAYLAVRQSYARDTLYSVMLKEQREVLIEALQTVTIDSQFEGSCVRPPLVSNDSDIDPSDEENIEEEEDCDEDDDAADDINYALPVDLLSHSVDDSSDLQDSNVEHPWTPGDYDQYNGRIFRPEGAWVETASINRRIVSVDLADRNVEKCKSDTCDPSDSE